MATSKYPKGSNPSLNSNPDIDFRLLENFVKDLEDTTNQVQLLLNDIRETEVEFSAIKTELKIFGQNLKELSDLVREGGNGKSIMTRMVVIEKSVTDIETRVKEMELAMKNANKPVEKNETSAVKVADTTGKWQAIIAVTTGVIALITSIVGVIGKH